MTDIAVGTAIFVLLGLQMFTGLDIRGFLLALTAICLIDAVHHATRRRRR